MKTRDAVRSDRGISTGPSIWDGNMRRRSRTEKFSDAGVAEGGVVEVMRVGVRVGIAVVMVVVVRRSTTGASGVVGGVAMDCRDEVDASSV